MKPATRSRSGQPRDQDGRFIKLGSKEEETGTVQAKQQVVATVQVAAVVSAEEDVDSAEDNEVSECESDGSSFISSSAKSEFGIEEDGKSVGAGEHNSGLSKPVGELLADQVFDQLRQSGPAVLGVKMGAVDSARAHVGTIGVAQKAP